MPNIKKIKETMKEKNISSEKIARIIDIDENTNDPVDIISVIEKMDMHLTNEECLSVMECQGCCKTGKIDKECKKYAKENGSKTLTEKIWDISNTIMKGHHPVLNEDGTITTGISWFKNGQYCCACSTIKKLKDRKTITPMYCGCCAGHFMYHYQNILGVKLKLKQIVSSPLNTNGEMPCEFLFKIVD